MVLADQETVIWITFVVVRPSKAMLCFQYKHHIRKHYFFQCNEKQHILVWSTVYTVHNSYNQLGLIGALRHQWKHHKRHRLSHGTVSAVTKKMSREKLFVLTLNLHRFFS